MKKIIVFAATAILSLLSCGHGLSNKYLGQIPTLISERNNAEWEAKGKYNELIAKEENKLEGVRIPCVSGNPDFFEIVGDNAVFHNGRYNVMLRFRAPVYVESICDVIFASFKGNGPLGKETQVFSNMSGTYTEGDCVIKSFVIYPDTVYGGESWDEGLKLLQNNTELFLIEFGKDKISSRRRSKHNTNFVPTQEDLNYYINNGFDEATKEAILSVKPQASPAVQKNAANMVGDYEFVDLGLSVNWAIDNIGDFPGEKFAWGETSPKEKLHDGYMWSEDDCWEKYSFYKGMTTSFPYRRLFSKYVIGGDNKNVLDSVDDPATTIMGAPWRTPTKEEWQELITKCKETTADAGEIGLVGPNGNKIFFAVSSPYGEYWTSSLYDTYEAWFAQIGHVWNGSAVNLYTRSRYDILYVRGVVDKK